MKTSHLIITSLTIGLIQISACGETVDELSLSDSKVETNMESSGELTSFQSYIDQFPTGQLSDQEITGVQFMREEEKLARDIYLALNDKWDVLTFKNISKSEQVHMDAILGLLNKYDIQDPAEGNTVGVFTNEDLQKLYNQLIEKGNSSLVDALQVGALIEETDIEDLQNILDEDVQSEDIKFVLTNLKRASGYHLRAFVGKLKLYNVDYAPEILDIDTFNDLVEK